MKIKPIIQILKITLVAIMLILISNPFSQAAKYVGTPASCPATDATEYPGINCSPNNICGDNSGTPQCYATQNIAAPAVSASSATIFSALLAGGYIIDCFATIDSAAPYCDNNTSAWCNADSSCLSVNRLTSCTEHLWLTFACGTCVSGYTYCDTSYVDPDGCEIQIGVTPYPSETNANYASNCTPQCNSTYYDCNANLGGAVDGCEIENGDSCPLGNLTGTWSCSAGAGSCTDGAGTDYDCTCSVAKLDFETGTNTEYSSDDPLLWGTQHGAGSLLQLGTDTTANLFSVNNDGSVQLAQISAPITTTSKLYNVSGSLYWDGVALGGGGGGAINRSIVYKVEYPGYSVYPDATDNIINLFVDYEVSAGRNCYDTRTEEILLQDIDIIVDFPIPSGFTAWQATPLEFYYKTDTADALENYIQIVSIKDTSGNPVTFSPISSTEYVNTSWTKQAVTFSGSPTWTPNQNMIIQFKLAQKTGTPTPRAALGEMLFHYVGTT